MSAFHTRSPRGNKFTVNPKIVRSLSGKAWVIAAYCDDVTKYGGLYTAIVGWAYENTDGRYGWRLKRDAIRGMNEAVAAGTLRLEARV